MARPARATGAVAMTLLLTLPFLLLPAPASSQGVVGAFLRLPAVRQFGKAVVKEVAKAGGEALIKQAFASGSASTSTNVKLLGSAAADDAAYIIYNVSNGPEPQQTFYGILDILNEFLWVSYPNPTAPPFNSLPCESDECTKTLNSNPANCADTTGDDSCLYIINGTNTRGFLAAETLTLGAQNMVGKVVFGCSTDTMLTGDNYGSVGFSQGSLSILQQLGVSRFSYFLAPVNSDTPYSGSAVLLGAQAVPQTKRSRSTPLVASKAYRNLYFVQLTGIQVDGVWLTGIPAGAFDLAADGGSGGVVLSTTIFLTYLQEDAYNALKQALVSKIGSAQVKSSDGFDLCYSTQSVSTMTFPKITLVFAGADSPAMDLTTVHYFFKDSTTGLQCLTILPTPDNVPFGSILGSMLQAGTNMIYDAAGGQLTFESSGTAGVSSQLVIASLLLVLVWVLLF